MDQMSRDEPNGKKPAGGKDQKKKGRNVAGKPPKRETEKVDGKKVQGAWGDLPDYVLKHGRGSMPTVPEKYRKYLEALTKEGHKKKK